MKVNQLFEAISLPNLTARLESDAIINYTTNVTLTGGKKNGQIGRVTKKTTNLPVYLIGNGTAYVDKRRETEPEFVVQARRWGERDADGLIQHKGETYVEFLVHGRGNSVYFLDGQPIDKSQVIGLPAYVDSPIRCVKISGIDSIT